SPGKSSRRWHSEFSSPVDLAEDDIDRTENRAHIGQHRFAAEKIHRGKMREARRPDLATIGLIGAIRDEIDTEFSLGSLDRAIDFAGRHMETFGIELEVMDQRLHRTLHF